MNYQGRIVYVCVCVCVCVSVWVLVTQSCPTLCNPMDCSLPDWLAHGILQARILEWVAIPFSRVCSQPKDWTLVSCAPGRFFTIWATIRVGAKCNHKCSYKRAAKGALTYGEEKAMGWQKQRLWWCSHKPRNASSHQKLEEASSAMWGHRKKMAIFEPGSQFSPYTESARTWILDIPASRAVTNTHSVVYKLCYFVLVAQMDLDILSTILSKIATKSFAMTPPFKNSLHSSYLICFLCICWCIYYLAFPLSL